MCHIVSPKWRPNAEIAWHHDRYPRALVHKTREGDFGKNDTISMRSPSSNEITKTSAPKQNFLNEMRHFISICKRQAEKLGQKV